MNAVCEKNYDLHSPIPTRASKDVIFNLAEEMRRDLNLRSGMQLQCIVEANGGKIVYPGLLEDDQSTALHVRADGSFQINLCHLRSISQNNFIIAHELGHFVLHWPKVREAYENASMVARKNAPEDDKDLVRCDWEANWFAAGLLMPKDEFLKVYHDEGASRAAQHLGVSENSIHVRKRSLEVA